MSQSLVVSCESVNLELTVDLMLPRARLESNIILQV